MRFSCCLRCCQIDTRKKNGGSWRFCISDVFGFLPSSASSFRPPSTVAILDGRWQEKAVFCLPWQRDKHIANCFARKVCSSYAGVVRELSGNEGTIMWNGTHLTEKQRRIGNERTTVNQSGIQQKFRSKDLYLPLSYSPWPSAFSNWSFLRFYFWSNDSFSIDRISGYLTVALCAHLSWKFPFDYCLHCVLHLKDQHWANAQ